MIRKPMILVAGPYRSGTGDDPTKIAENLRQMEQVALQLFELGFVPMVGEWIALPLIKVAGSRQVGDPEFTRIFHPVAIQLLAHCDGVLRIGGASEGADQMAALARQAGKPVFTAPEEIQLG